MKSQSIYESCAKLSIQIMLVLDKTQCVFSMNGIKNSIGKKGKGDNYICVFDCMMEKRRSHYAVWGLCNSPNFCLRQNG